MDGLGRTNAAEYAGRRPAMEYSRNTAAAASDHSRCETVTALDCTRCTGGLVLRRYSETPAAAVPVSDCTAAAVPDYAKLRRIAPGTPRPQLGEGEPVHQGVCSSGESTTGRGGQDEETGTARPARG